MDRSAQELLVNWTDETADVSARRKKLVKDIKRFSWRYVNGNVENILLVGKVGAGKSGFINSVAKVVNGEYYLMAPMGSGGEQSKTLEVLRYKNFGAQTNFPPLEEHNDESIDEVRERLPNVTDFAGLADIDEPLITEIFDLLLRGTTYRSLERDRKRYGSLKAKYNRPKPEWKITKIVFVQSCTDDVPTNLFSCLLKAIRATDDESDAIKYTADIFLLITKYDRVQNINNNGQEQAANTNLISMDAFVRVENTLAGLFKIEGNLEFNRLRWINYCTDTEFNNQNIDLNALEFLKLMQMPTVPRDFTPPIASLWTTLKLEIELYIRSYNFTNRQKIMIGVILVLGILVVLLWVPVRNNEADSALK